MKRIEKENYAGERSLFKLSDAAIFDCTFLEGESPLKEAKNIEVNRSTFCWKYPFWYGEHIKVNECTLQVMARAGMWYDRDISFVRCHLDCPKAFRKSEEVRLEECDLTDGDETLWWCKDIHIEKCTIKGNYLLMGSENVAIKGLTLHGNYPFDGCKNIEVSDSILISKDAFWNCENVVIRNSYIEGEYFGWNSKNVTLIDCEIHSHQGFCYMGNVKLVRCKLVDSDLTFEYCSDIDAEILGKVDSIKNPLSGVISCQGVGELILDDDTIDHSQTRIETNGL